MKRIQEEALTPTQLTLLGLLGQVLFDRPYTPPSDTDWDAVLRESYVQGVLSLAFSRCNEWPDGGDVCARVKPHLRRMMMRDTAIHNAHTTIHRLMTAENIPYTILKGTVSAYYYPQPHLRSMGDVDFLVDRADLDGARDTLLANGYVITSKPQEASEEAEEHHVVMSHKGCKVELHYEIPGVPNGPMGEKVRAHQARIIPESQLTETETATYMRPSDFHHGLIMLLHVQEHLLCEGIGLRHLCDWAVFVDRFDNDSFTALFKQPLEALGLWTFARCLSLASVHYMGLPLREWMGDDADSRAVSVALLQDFLAGGNFGAKDENRERVYESALIGDSANKDVNKGQLRNGLSAVNAWVKNRWPAARKCPLLLPFGWIYFLLRRAVLVLTGRKKRIRMNATLQKSRERQKLYRRLKLFETT